MNGFFLAFGDASDGDGGGEALAHEGCGGFRERNKKAAGCLGIVEELEEGRIDGFGGGDAGGGELAIVVEAARDCALLGIVEGSGEEWDTSGVDFERDVGGESHLAGMAKEAEAGDVGAGVDGETGERFGGGAVEGEHGGDGGIDVLRSGEAALEGGADDAGSDLFGEQEDVVGASAGVGPDAIGVDRAGDGITKLDVFVVDAVAADDGAGGFDHFGGSAFEDLAEDGEVAFAGVGEDGERGDGTATHGVDVAEGVGGGDGAEGERIVDDGGEEVDGLDEGTLRAQPVDARIIGRIEAYQHVRVGRIGQVAQNVVQNLWTQFRRSTGGLGVRG